MKIIWCMVPETRSATDRILSFWTVFCPFTPLRAQKIKSLKKWKKHVKDIIILQMCTVNDNHLMHGSWDMECNGQNFLSFWVVFCTFTPQTTRKIKIFKKWNKNVEILYFTHVNRNWKSYDVWFLKYGEWRTEFFIVLDHFLHFYPLTTWKIKILKKWNKHLDILSFYTCEP